MELGITTFAETYADPTTRQDLGIERFLLHVSVGTCRTPRCCAASSCWAPRWRPWWLGNWPAPAGE